MIGAVIVGLSLIVSSGATQAGKVYNCTVTQFLKMQVDLGLEGDPEAAQPLIQLNPALDTSADFHVGKRFSIDTQTGVLIGEIMNVTSPDVKRYILNEGGLQSSFQLLEVWGPIRSTRFTLVAEYDRKGNKPFVMMDAGDILSGECQ
jgi:hypothetical protein